jgi:protein TonB
MKSIIIFKNQLLALTLILGLGLMVASCKSDSAAEAEAEVDEAVAELKSDVAMATSNAETAMPEAKSRTIYNITQVDRPPLFSADCAKAENPRKCSEDKILAFIKDNAKFPKAASTKNQDGFEQVIFVVEKDGSLADVKYAASSEADKCDGCQQAAVDVVGLMTKWEPAMKDGKAVAVQMTVPVRFRSTM